jgi:hypothetical protein
VVEPAHRVLGIRAAVVADGVLRSGTVDEHAIADGHVLDVRTDGFDFAARIGSGNERQGGLARICAAADVDIDRIDADGSQPNHHLIGIRHRIGDVLELQHLRAAMFSHDDRFHAAMLS